MFSKGRIEIILIIRTRRITPFGLKLKKDTSALFVIHWWLLTITAADISSGGTSVFISCRGNAFGCVGGGLSYSLEAESSHLSHWLSVLSLVANCPNCGDGGVKSNSPSRCLKVLHLSFPFLWSESFAPFLIGFALWMAQPSLAELLDKLVVFSILIELSVWKDLDFAKPF